MKRTILFFALVATGFSMPKLYAQTEQDTVKPGQSKSENELRRYYDNLKKVTKEGLDQELLDIKEAEKEELKKRINEIDGQFEKGEITAEKAKALKEEAAKRAAQNIDNKTAIIQNQMALVERDIYYSYEHYNGAYLNLGLGQETDEKGSFLLGLEYNAKGLYPRKDRRTSFDIVAAFGVGGATGGGTKLGDTYKVWKSAYSEIGFTLRSRLLKESNFWRLAYGISFQQNQLSISDNKQVVNNSGYTALEPFPYRIKRNDFSVENLVVPVMIEFGPSKKKDYRTYFRYDTSKSFKVGLGGFIGVNTGAIQRMKYEINDKEYKIKLRQDYNTEKFIYGLKGYVGFGSLSLFANYELNSIFSNSAHKDHALYFGVRVDL
ncbi:hypothetical protein ACLI09_12775 [Flavobacterium sp. RHBU_24]|uniref:hypothetical protein n=1 Tax=Flavobacterium sp. RHBU_24 TaxID=3391185 RepID=UPI0039854695